MIVHCELDRKDIISLLKGTTPSYSVMNKIPEELGSFIGGHVEKWEWNNFSKDIPFTDEYLYNLYLMCSK